MRGAGIGYSPILLEHLRPSARVFCFEPLREHAAHLRSNLALNGIDQDTVQIFDVAVCDSIGRHAFHQEDFGSRLLSAPTPTSSIVGTTTLEAIVEGTTGPPHSHDLHQACRAGMQRHGFAILFEDAAPLGQPDELVVAVAPERKLLADRSIEAG